MRKPQELDEEQKLAKQQEQENMQGQADLPTLEEKLIYQKILNLKHGGMEE